ncbi:hypothetical protein ABE949_16350 [Enterococcus avium]|uniref:hypothetical protein n=1 Tax=Enterococcus avium TaxID=33945 RepID=UPI003D6AF4EF
MELLKYLDAEADKLHEENFSSSDEFRTVNHSFVEGFNYALAIVQGFEIELNKNQQIVLNQAKINAGTEGSLIKAIHSIYSLNFTPEKAIDNEWAENWIAARKAMCQLSRKEEAEVFAILAEWGMKEVAE